MSWSLPKERKLLQSSLGERASLTQLLKKHMTLCSEKTGILMEILQMKRSRNPGGWQKIL